MSGCASALATLGGHVQRRRSRGAAARHVADHGLDTIWIAARQRGRPVNDRVLQGEQGRKRGRVQAVDRRAQGVRREAELLDATLTGIIDVRE
jgi:hypothetical protein